MVHWQLRSIRSDWNKASWELPRFLFRNTFSCSRSLMRTQKNFQGREWETGIQIAPSMAARGMKTLVQKIRNRSACFKKFKNQILLFRYSIMYCCSRKWSSVIHCFTIGWNTHHLLPVPFITDGPYEARGKREKNLDGSIVTALVHITVQHLTFFCTFILRSSGCIETTLTREEWIHAQSRTSFWILFSIWNLRRIETRCC